MLAQARMCCWRRWRHRRGPVVLEVRQAAVRAAARWEVVGGGAAISVKAHRKRRCFGGGEQNGRGARTWSHSTILVCNARSGSVLDCHTLHSGLYPMEARSREDGRTPSIVRFGPDL